MATSDTHPEFGVYVPDVTLAVARGASGGVPSGSWVFQALSYLAPLTMAAVYPRPDSETLSTAYHRKAHTGRTYRIPVGVRGGCWPYRYEIISGPAGATIMQELVREVDGATGKTLHKIVDDYGVVTLDTSGMSDGDPFSFTVRVTDQLGTSVDLTWSGAVDNAAFVFVDSVAGSDTNAGTQAAPLQTFANGLWKNSDADNTYAGKIAVCSGTMDINAGTLDTSPILNSAVKPVAYVSDRPCTFNMSRGHFRTGNTLNDPLFIGIDFDGSRSDLPNNRIFNFTNIVNRPVFFECSWDNNTVGTVGNDNPGCLCFMGVGSTLHSYIFVSKCELCSNAKAQLLVTFDSNHVLVERNTGESLSIPASNGDKALHLKDDTSNLTVRANTFIGTTGLSMIQVSNQNTLTPLIENQEVCYNTVIHSTGGGQNGAIFWNAQSTSPDGQNTHDYRNTVISLTSRSWRLHASSTDSYTPNAGASVWSAPSGAGLDGTTMADAPASVEIQSADYDALGKLVGTARTNYLGTYGAELAGD